MDDTKTLKFILKEYAIAVIRIKELESDLKESEERVTFSLVEEMKLMAGLCPDLLGEDKPEVDDNRYIAFAGGAGTTVGSVNNFFCKGNNIDAIADLVTSNGSHPYLIWCDILDIKNGKVVISGILSSTDPFSAEKEWEWKQAGNEG